MVEERMGRMSNALGEVWSKDGNRYGYFEYHGTTDTAFTRVFITKEEYQSNRRKDNCRTCTCDASGETIILYSSYGFGYYWSAVVCWNCMAIKHGADPADCEDERGGHPFFKQWMMLEFGRLLPCPHCKQEKLESDGDKMPIKCGACGRGFYTWQVIPKAVKSVDTSVVAEQ